MAVAVKKQVYNIRVESGLVTGGCTKYIQTPDVSQNKAFKAHVIEQYDNWLVYRVYEYTAGGNIKPAPSVKVVKQILNFWKSMPVELIVKSFRLSASTDKKTTKSHISNQEDHVKLDMRSSISK